MKKKETILLTGGTGFLGSFILRLLLEKGYRVICLRRHTSNMFRVQDLQSNADVEFVDYEIGKEVHIFKLNTPEYIIHTATCYGRNGESEHEITEANFDFPLSLLQTGRNNGLKGFINTDTFFTEDLGLSDGEQLYVRTKKEFLSNARDEAPDIKLINLKLEQMYGPSDKENKFIPIMIKRLKSGGKISLTEGEQKRDFVYVEDVAKAFLSVLEHFDELSKFEEFEIGTGKSRSIKEVMEILKVDLKSDSILDWGAIPYRTNELMDSYAKIFNNRKIGWKAKVTLDDGLRKTIEYCSNHV